MLVVLVLPPCKSLIGEQKSWEARSHMQLLSDEQVQLPRGKCSANFQYWKKTVLDDHKCQQDLHCLISQQLCPEFHLKRYAQMEVKHLIQVCCLEAQHFWYPSNFPEKNKNCKLPVDSNSLNLIEDNKLLYNLCLDVWRINWIKQFF